MRRSSYHVRMVFNKQQIDEIIIDQHYSKKHPEMNDDIILSLVRKLNSQYRIPAKQDDDFLYFVEDPIIYNLKPYRLIYFLQKNCHYIGVVNAFRVGEKKK